MDGLKSAALFLGGCLVGGAVAWFAAEKKYELQLEEEVDSVKATYKRSLKSAHQHASRILDLELAEIKNNTEITKNAVHKKTTSVSPTASVYEPDDDGEDKDEDEDQDSIDELLETEGYIPRREVTRSADEPYVISPDEFSETPDGYHTISLYYYADKVLAGERDEVVEDVEDVVGFDSLNHFGEYEDDAVYVRNEARRCDYEILLCLSSYREKFKDRVRWVTTDK